MYELLPPTIIFLENNPILSLTALTLPIQIQGCTPNPLFSIDHIEPIKMALM
jgi:hypothetical protein